MRFAASTFVTNRHERDTFLTFLLSVAAVLEDTPIKFNLHVVFDISDSVCEKLGAYRK